LLASHPVGAVLRNLERVPDLERGDATGGQRWVQLDPHEGAILGRFEGASDGLTAGRSDGLDTIENKASTKATCRKARVGGIQQGTTAVVSKKILVELQPDVAQRIRRAVCVTDRFATGDRVRRRVERDGDRIVHALLPVRRPWPAGSFTQQRRCGKLEAPEWRSVSARGGQR